MDLVMLMVGNGMSWFLDRRRWCAVPVHLLILIASARKNSRNAAAPRRSRGLFVISADRVM
jgi:hypothetical protein